MFWSGVGPGNFRAAYLRYKLPESSEEILDPHNLFLEVWATAGFWALLALLAALVLGLREPAGTAVRAVAQRSAYRPCPREAGRVRPSRGSDRGRGPTRLRAGRSGWSSRPAAAGSWSGPARDDEPLRERPVLRDG